MAPKVAIVSRDADVREAAARAFAAAPAEWAVALHEDDPPDATVVVRGPDLLSGAEIVFDPERPDEAVRAVARALGGGRVYVVVAAAGGTGATTVALHVAAALDGCYAELTDPSPRLGLPRDARPWSPEDEELTALPVAGIRVLRAPRPCPEPSEFPLDLARARFTPLVLDVGTRRNVHGAVAASSVAVVVTTPTRPGALAAREMVEAFPECAWAVVVNRLGPGGQIMRAGLEGLLGRRITVELPCCPALRDAEDEARLLTGTWRRWTRGVARLVRALEAC